MARSRFLPDNFTLALLGTVTLASVLPASGVAAQALEGITVAAVALLFFLHGAKLSRDAIVAGLSHWRLHLVVVGTTFVLFPLLGWALRPVLLPLVTPGLYTGILYLCVLPATVQSAIAFTAMARGNMSAAICSASASTLPNSSQGSASSRSRIGSRPTPMKRSRAAHSVRRPSISTRPICISATTACR